LRVGIYGLEYIIRPKFLYFSFYKPPFRRFISFFGPINLSTKVLSHEDKTSMSFGSPFLIEPLSSHHSFAFAPTIQPFSTPLLMQTFLPPNPYTSYIFLVLECFSFGEFAHLIVCFVTWSTGWLHKNLHKPADFCLFGEEYKELCWWAWMQ
jgi:hypothetical protein